MLRRWVRILAVALGALTCTGTSYAAEAPLGFDTSGGDAWTFDKRVSGHLNAAACDNVLVEGPAGSAVAVIDGNHFSAEVPLTSGSNEIRAVCRLKGREVARSSPQRWLTRLDDRPRAWIRTRAADRTLWLDAGHSEPASGAAAPIVRYEWRSRIGNAAPLILTSGATSLATAPAIARTIQIRAPDVDGEYYVTLRVTDSLGRSDESTAVFEVIDGTPREVDLARYRPEWVRRATVYGVAPFAFGNEGYDDVRKRLREIAALGVSVIWLSPITAAAPEDFGYAVTDHFASRPGFGTAKQLRALIEAAHALGLRVIMDFVPNHFSTTSRYYADAERQRERSPYFDWFERDGDGEPTHYFDWQHLKNLEYDHPEVQRYMIEAFAHWVREFGIDGFRVDVSWGVRERAPEFWPRWREELKRIDPDLLLIAEASARDGYYFTHGFDAAYDWTTKLGEWAWNDVFAEAGSPPDLDKLRAALKSSSVDLPEPGIVLRFLNNNDTGARFITRHGIEQTRVAATMLFTLPGLPLIYNGDEVGAEFEPYEEQPLSWRDPHGLYPYYTRLTQLRKEVPALSSSEIEILSTDRDKAVLAYLRTMDMPRSDVGTSCADPGTVLVLLNFTRETMELRLPSTTAVMTFLGRGEVHDLQTNEKLPVTAANTVRLKPFGARVLSAGTGSCLHTRR